MEKHSVIIIVLDSQLKFDPHIRKVSRIIQSNLNCFLMRSYLHAQLYKHTMILSYCSYCVIVWGQAIQPAMELLLSQFRQTLKIMAQKLLKWLSFITQKKTVTLF